MNDPKSNQDIKITDLISGKMISDLQSSSSLTYSFFPPIPPIPPMHIQPAGTVMISKRGTVVNATGGKLPIYASGKRELFGWPLNNHVAIHESSTWLQTANLFGWGLNDARDIQEEGIYRFATRSECWEFKREFPNAIIRMPPPENTTGGLKGFWNNPNALKVLGKNPIMGDMERFNLYREINGWDHLCQNCGHTFGRHAVLICRKRDGTTPSKDSEFFPSFVIPDDPDWVIQNVIDGKTMLSLDSDGVLWTTDNADQKPVEQSEAEKWFDAL